MFTNIENIKIESIYAGTVKKPLSHTCRKSNTLVLRTSGSVRYVFPEITFEVFPGDIIFLPRGSRYELVPQPDVTCDYVAIRLEDELYNEKPFAYSIEGFPEAFELENNMPDMWKFGEMAEHYRCYAVVYSLLSYLKNLEKLTYADKKKSNIIAPAISYLKEHIYDCNLKIDTLIQLCGVSGTYFHKIFKANYSVSPQKYILSKRLSHARSVIDNGDFNSISEISALVGYNDPLYFSRAFKKKYGISPLHYAEQIFIHEL